ncbi:hypothetical protein LINGRAHAP2_LOCUS34706 [Linum grandiflorum]
MGKSSFVAAIKNFPSYDVYEIDLSSGRDDSPEGDPAAGDEQVGDRVVIEELDRFRRDLALYIEFHQKKGEREAGSGLG